MSGSRPTLEVIRELAERLATKETEADELPGSFAKDLRACVKRQPTLKAQGKPTECQLVAWFFVQTVNASLSPRLIHGLVRLSPASEPFFHAWAEIADACIDLTQARDRWVMSREQFYAYVDGEIVTYSPMDALMKSLASQEYGPWDERLKDERFFPHLRK